MAETKVGPQVYTQSVQELTQFLKEKFPDGIQVSDVHDNLGRQYVDLVQEGGGVHGIALAGYTYVLECMNISFMKMAGTSAGSINTLLLNAVCTYQEADELKKHGKLHTDNTYYATRSEKVLEYLAKQDLADFVDGHFMWRNLVLGLFESSKQKGFGRWLAMPRRMLKLAAAAIAVLLLSALFLSFYQGAGSLFLMARWAAVLSAAGLVAVTTYFISKGMLARLLYKHAEKLGINPGKAFEEWLDKILEENGVETVKKLNQKLRNEVDVLRPKFPSRKHVAVEDEAGTGLQATITKHAAIDGAGTVKTTVGTLLGKEPPSGFIPPEDLQEVMEHIANPTNRVELLSDDVNKLKGKSYGGHDAMEFIMKAFHQRLENELEYEDTSRVTKEMVIVTSDINHGLKVEFPGMHRMYWGNNYNISPALYVRASVSVPIFFKPMQVDFDAGQKKSIKEAWMELVKIDKDPKGCALFVDGGLLSNFPINVFHDPSRPVPRKPTFGIKLEYEDDSEPVSANNLKAFAGCMINTMRYFYDRDFAQKHEQFTKTVRSVDTGNIHWLNFKLTEREKVELFFRGALTATIFLARHGLNDSEIESLKHLGNKVPLDGTTFSIYGDEVANCSFKTEDCLKSDVTFEWQAYKKDRLETFLKHEERRNTIKKNASPEADDKK